MISDFWSERMQTKRQDQIDLESFLSALSIPNMNMLIINYETGAGVGLHHLEAIKRMFLGMQILLKDLHSDLFICPGSHSNCPSGAGREYRMYRGGRTLLSPHDPYQYYESGSCHGAIRIYIESDGDYGEYSYPVAEDGPDNTHNCTEMLNLNENDWSGDIWGQYHERLRLRHLLRQTLGEEVNRWL